MQKSGKYFVFLSFAIFFFCSSIVMSEQLAFKKYTQASGLSSNYIFDIIQDRDGFIWIATDRGVSRFNGQSFQNFTKTDGLAANHTYCIFQDRDGDLWFGTYDGGVVHYDHYNFHVINEEHGLLNNTVLHITQDHFGRMYFMTEHGLTVYQDSVVAIFENASHYSGNMFLHPSGKVFFNLDNDLYILTPESELPLQPQKVNLSQERDKILKTRSWASPALTSQNRLLFPGRNECLEIQLDEVGHIIHIGIIEKELFAILEDHSGSLWLAERHGVRVLNGDRSALLSKEQGLDPDYVEAMLEDFEGNKWLGTMGGGLYKYKGDHLTYFTANSGLLSDFVNAVFEDSLGRILVGSTQGLSIIDKNYTIQNIPSEVDPKEVLSINQDRYGNFYYGTFIELYGPLSKSLRTTDRKKQVRYFPSGVSSIFADTDDTIWASTYGLGVIRIKDGAETSLLKTDGLPADVIEEIVPGCNALWFLSRENGAARLRQNTIQIFGREQGLPSEAIFSVLEEKDGAIWFGTDRGVTCLSGDQIKTYSQDQGLIGSYVLGIYKYKNRYLIISDKALHFLKDDKLTVCAGSALLPDSEALIKKVFLSEKTGTLWLATNGGVVRVDLARVEARGKWLKNREPNILITEVKCDTNIIYQYKAAGKDPQKAAVELTHQQNNIHITFCGLSFLGEAPLQYRYRLNGGKESWSDPTTKDEVIYHNLGSGDYTFSVHAINSVGIQSRNQASFSFTILPPFWLRPWFYIPGYLLGIGLFALGVYFRSIQKLHSNIKRLEQEKALQEERVKTRERIAAELHDDVSSTLGSISLYSESLKSRLNKEPEKSEEYLNKLNDLTHEAQEIMEEVVWSLSPQHDTLKELILRISDYAGEFCCDNNLSCNLVTMESTVDFIIDEVTRKNIYMILKEAMHNIQKHARATQIKIRVGVEQEYFLLEITDNGQGFNREALPRKSKGGHGLFNMENRARQIKAQLDIFSESGQGVQILLRKEIAHMRY